MSTVLIADDDPDILDLVSFKLEQAGHTLVTASDGTSALAEARRSSPDVAVIDVAMPGLSGLDVCRELRADAMTANIPIILLTARAQDSDVEIGFEVGADDYLTKPFSPRELVSRVAAVISRTQA
jgi:DNA-binding response OmpR family regulator